MRPLFLFVLLYSNFAFTTFNLDGKPESKNIEDRRNDPSMALAVKAVVGMKNCCQKPEGLWLNCFEVHINEKHQYSWMKRNKEYSKCIETTVKNYALKSKNAKEDLEDLAEAEASTFFAAEEERNTPPDPIERNSSPN